jgi:uncharacterized membrane protein
VSDAESGGTVFTVLVAIAVVLAIVGVVTRPFLLEPIAVICLLIATRQTESRRFTTPAMLFVTVCFVVGAAIAAATSNPLY